MKSIIVSVVLLNLHSLQLMQDLDGLQSWVGKKRGQEAIFFNEEEIRFTLFI